MAKNILVVSCDIADTRVALIENGIIAELHIERRGAQPRGGTVGDIYLGKVTRVLPGLQAAFVDIGLERAAFLHVEDLIRPDDFEAYLAGGRKQTLGTSDNGHGPTGEGEVAHDQATVAHDQATVAHDEPELVDEGEAVEDSDAPDEGEAAGDSDAPDEGEAAGDSDAPDEGEAVGAGDTAGDSDAPDEGEAVDPSGPRGAGDGPDESDATGESEAGPDETSATARSGGHDEPSPNERLGGPSDDRTNPDLDRTGGLAIPLEALAARGPVDLTPPSDPDLGEEGGDDANRPEEASPGTSLRPSRDAPAGLRDRAAPRNDAVNRPAPPDAEDDAFDDLLDNPNLPGFTISEPGAPMPRAPAPRVDGRDGRGGDRRRRRRGRDRGRSNGRTGRDSPNRESPNRDGPNRESPNRDHRDRPRTNASAGRLSKSTPIRDVVKEGQDILVQITKEPIGTKGARCSSHVSLPGRYVVYLPTLEHVGVSKRIGSDKERARLREAIEAMKPPAGGLIVRTVAEGLTKKQLKQDVGYLVHLWGEVAKKHEGAKAPALLLGELDIVLKTARDLLTDEVDELVIDDRAQYDRLCRFVEMFMPERLKDIVYYGDSEPIFDAYGIEDEISRALSRKVPLPSGGYLILDEAEALTAIDVNTGRFVGKGSKDMEETILKTNLEAVQEIAYQLRFRNIGGLIILDLIDMEKSANREKVRKTLEDLLQRDKAKTTLNRISELGLIEMTRKRTRESLGRLLHEPCFYCDGTGHLQSKETVAYEILREIRRKRQDLPGYTILVNCHPAVADLLTGSEKTALQEAETRFMRRIQVASRSEYHLEQFDLSGK